MDQKEFYVALLSGGIAGTAVDVSLFPLDTIKTRLQSSDGFHKAGGFRGIYSGIASAAIGSAPTAALFFCMYEFMKSFLYLQTGTSHSPLVNSAAASMAEVAACLIRVPVEVVKQRSQANVGMSSYASMRKTFKTEGVRGFYRGYLTTVLREVPFSFLQFPMWEYFKFTLSEVQGSPTLPWQSAVCGAVSGAIAAGVTTPLDVAKTRIILAQRSSEIASGHIFYALKTVYKENGIKSLFAGVLPRMLWISLGGAVFLGVYDKSRTVFHTLIPSADIVSPNAR